MRRLLEFKLMPNKATTSTASTYKDKLQKLIDYHVAQYPYKTTTPYCATISLKDSEIELLNEDRDTVWLDYSEVRIYTPGRTKPTDETKMSINIKYNKQSTEWTFEVYFNDDLPLGEEKGKSFNDLINNFSKYLFQLPAKGTTEYKEITESFNSTIDDFEAYENLWS